VLVSTVRRTQDGFVLEDEAQPVGRVAFAVEPTCPPELLGELPPDELFLTDLELSSDGDWLSAGRHLIPEALVAIAGTVPDRLQVRTNPEARVEHAKRVALFDALGMDLSQEKEGLHLARSRHAGSRSRPARLPHHR
jgi:hypothetical protein